MLDDHRLTADEGLAILRSGDDELLDLLAAAYRVRHRWFGNRVDSELPDQRQERACGEDCGYCSQSRVSKAEIPRYRLVTADEILEGARIGRRTEGQNLLRGHLRPLAQRRRNSTRSARSCREVKAAFGLKICFSVGLLSLEQARRLKACGVDRINHNLNTSERFYPQICTTHSLPGPAGHAAKTCGQAGLEICSGGIVGMGEEDADVVELALRLGQLQAEAVPVNFLLPIPGIRHRHAFAGQPFRAGSIPATV